MRLRLGPLLIPFPLGVLAVALLLAAAHQAGWRLVAASHALLAGAEAAEEQAARILESSRHALAHAAADEEAARTRHARRAREALDRAARSDPVAAIGAEGDRMLRLPLAGEPLSRLAADVSEARAAHAAQIRRVLALPPGPAARAEAAQVVLRGATALVARLAALSAALDRERERLASLLAWGTALALSVIGGGAMLLAGPILHLRARSQRMLRAMEQRSDRLAHTDPATGLANLRGVERHVRRQPPDRPIRVLLVEFRPADGTSASADPSVEMGIATEMAARLRALESDAAVLARMRSTLFCLVPAGDPDAAALEDLFTMIRRLSNEPVHLCQQRLRVQAAIGTARRRPNRPSDRLLADAHLALDAALKGLRAGRVAAQGTAVYTPELRRAANRRARLAAELSEGILRGQIVAHFQPQMCLATGRIAGMEALARWQHPARGLLAPALFLPLAESRGLDEPLGEAMLRQALAALAAWDARGFEIRTVGVNMTRLQLSDPRLFDLIRWELDRFGVAPNRLSLEVLETVTAEHDEDSVTRNLRALAGVGVQIDLDDFGTGAASITGIRRFRASRIKIDRHFIRDIGSVPANEAMTRAMVNMARELGLKTLAEGMETPEELAAIRRLHCDYVQGFGLARPMPLAHTFDWVANHDRALAARTSAS